MDDPEHCRFSFGSIHRQGELTIAISTNGWAPAVAVRLKERFQREIGTEYGDFLELLKRRGRKSPSGSQFRRPPRVVVRNSGFGGAGPIATGRKRRGGSVIQEMINTAARP